MTVGRTGHTLNCEMCFCAKITKTNRYRFGFNLELIKD